MATENMKGGRTKKEGISSVIAETTMLAQSKSSSPADKVLSVDDLLTGILFRLPVRSLLRFKSVSKHWYFLITSPSFKLTRSRNPDPPSGLFVPIHSIKNKRFLEYEFVSFDIKNPVKAPFTAPNFDPNAAAIHIEHSSNGLMLCSSNSCEIIEENECVLPNQYHVYNPTINQFITLPGFENNDNSVQIFRYMSIAFDPSKSSDYRIICVCERYRPGNTSCQIEIFSSTTRTWKPSCHISIANILELDFTNGVYWNNAIHWIQSGGFVLYFNLDEESIHEKQTPLRLQRQDAYSNTLFESRDQMLLVELDESSLNTNFKIHELKRDYSAWSVKYLVDLEEVGGPFPEIRHPRFPPAFEFVVLFLVLGEKEDDSFLVVEIRGKALRFNLITKTFHKLHDLPASRYHKRNCVFSGLPNGYQFRESLYSF